MQRLAKVSKTNRSQAVRLPEKFQSQGSEVLIRKEGEELVLSPEPKSWAEYFATTPAASETYMDDVEDLPVQERDL